MLSKVAMSVVVGVITALVTALIGIVLVSVGVHDIGEFVKGIAPLVGLLAGVWYFFTNRSLLS